MEQESTSATPKSTQMKRLHAYRYMLRRHVYYQKGIQFSTDEVDKP